MREYRFTAGRRGFWVVVGSVFSGVALVGGILSWIHVAEEPGRSMMLVICAAFVILGLYTAFSIHRTRVILHDDAIELQGAFRRRRMSAADIDGFKVLATQQVQTIRLRSRRRGVRDLVIPLQVERDAAFDQWLARFPDLDHAEHARSEQDYFADENHRAPRAEKTRRLKHARGVAKFAQYVTYGAAAWGAFYPHPYDLVMLLLGVIPWIAVAIAVTGQGAYSLEGRDNDVRANLGAPLIAPGCILMLRAVLDLEILDWQRAFWIVAAVTAVGVGVLYWASSDFRRSRSSVLILPLLMGFYAWGASVLLDMELDTASPQVYTAQVLGKHMSSGNGRLYYLDVAAWGPVPEHGDVQTRRGLYDRVGEGSTVCVFLWPGALGVRWFEVDDCPGR